jgi:hypothetical protein
LTENDLGPDSVGAAEVQDNSIDSGAVANGVLNAVDVGDVVLINSAVAIDTVNGGDCNNYVVAAPAAGNLADAQIVVTPDTATASANLMYAAEVSATQNQFLLKVCNVTGSAIDDANTTFQFLAIR